MCEIAILKTDEYSTQTMTDISQTLHESMGSALGLVGVRESDDGKRFEYDIHKAVEPDFDEVKEFIDETVDDDAFRLIIHGRLATHGGRDEAAAHPIKVDCPECEVDYVLHNGVIAQHTMFRNQHVQQGHEYTTEVDSEVIAHEFGDIPTTFDEEEPGYMDFPDDFDREPSYILLNEDTMFIHGGTYRLHKRARMSRHRRDFGPPVGADDFNKVLMVPSEAK